jgi:uncharacterized membrane protein
LNAPPAASARFHFVDQLRGWAVLVMIETHVLNALLLPAIKEEFPFKILTFVNGLVAPSFLFCAGFAFAITMRKKWDDLTGFRPPLWKSVGRLLAILVVAYCLHIPVFSLRGMMALTDQRSWMVLFQSDILHVIALTLLWSLLLVVALRNRNVVVAATGFVFLAVVFLAPFIRELDYSTTAVWLRPYFTMQYRSQFPLVPWSAFLLGGILIGHGYLAARDRGTAERFMHRVGMLAAGAIGVSLLVEWQPVTLFASHDFWKASPEFFFVRFGIVGLALYGLWRQEQRGAFSANSPLALFGQESLLVYVAHLLIVYGYTFEFSFIKLWGPTLGYAESLGLTAALILGMYALAYGWRRLKSWNRQAATVAELGVVLATVLTFVLK